MVSAPIPAIEGRMAEIRHNQSIAATLAAALIQAAGRPHSIREAVDLYSEVIFVMEPDPGRASNFERLQSGEFAKPHV